MTCDVRFYRLDYHAILGSMNNLTVLSLTHGGDSDEDFYTDDEDDDHLYRGQPVLDIAFMARSSSLKKVWLDGWRLISADDHCNPLLQLNSLAIVECTMASTLLRKLIRSSRET